MKATALLKKGHAAVKKLFHDFKKAGDRAEKRKQDLFNAIYAELDRHAQIEEEIFYPAVESAASDLVEEARQEHTVVKDLLSEISGMSPRDEEFDAKVKVLMENVEHHIEEEEGEMFPRAEQQLRDERLEELGTELEARQEALKQGLPTRIMRSVKTLIFGEESGTTGGRRSAGRTGAKARVRGARRKGAQTKGRRAAGKGSRRRSSGPSRNKGTAKPRAAQSRKARGRKAKSRTVSIRKPKARSSRSRRAQ